MDENDEQRAITPFRHRHDGWTPERQEQFLERLGGTGCLREACRAVGLSKTSAYRAYHRMPEFATLWDRALASRRPMLEDAAFERAVRGVSTPLTRLGKVVGQRRQFSDGLLRFLIEREDRREAGPAKGRGGYHREEPSIEEVREEVLRRLNVMSQAAEEEKRAEALAWTERMEAEGKAP